MTEQYLQGIFTGHINLCATLLQKHSAKHQTGRLKQTGLPGKKEAEAEQKKATTNSTASEIQIKSCFMGTGKRILSQFLGSKCIQALGPTTCFVCSWHDTLSLKDHNTSVRNYVIFSDVCISHEKQHMMKFQYYRCH